MIYALVMTIHVLLALFLIIITLIQGGRGGLGEALGGAAAQSLFGGAANTVMTKLTAGVAGLFMVTSLVLAMLSTARGRSVVDRLPAAASEALPITAPEALPVPDAVQAPLEPALPSTEPPASDAGSDTLQ